MNYYDVLLKTFDYRGRVSKNKTFSFLNDHNWSTTEIIEAQVFFTKTDVCGLDKRHHFKI